MNLSTLILQHEAARRKRISLREQGVRGELTDEINIRQLAVWMASCATIDAANLTEERLPVLESKIPISLSLNDSYFEMLADKIVAEWTNSNMLEINNLPIEEYAIVLGSASAEIEAAILQIEKPEFAKMRDENPHFKANRQI